MGFLKKFVALVKGMPDWHEKYNQDVGDLYEAFNDMESEAGRSIIPCSAAYDSTNKVHVLTPLNSSQTIPSSGMVPVTFIPNADFHSGDKLRFNGQDCDAAYSNTNLAVADGAFRAGFVTSVVFQLLEKKGGTDRTCLAILHNGATAYASNAGKLNGLAPEAYIQPQVNILDNADWESCIINQQTKGEYIGNGHTIDRWSVNNKNIKLRVLKGKISVETLEEITAVSWAPNQDIESAERFQGKILTAATVIDFIDGDWSLFIRFADDNGYIAGPQKKLKTGLNILSYAVPDGTTHIKCGLLSQIQPAGKSVRARKIKLEEGPRFTGWPVWNYALELAKCQRYFYRIPEVIADGFISAAGIVNAAGTSAYTALNFPVPMRVKPTLKYGGNIVAYSEGKEYEFDALALWTETNKDPSYCIMRVNLQNTAIAGKPFLIKVCKGAWLEFNANL